MNNRAAPVVDLDGTGSARLNSFREQGEPVQAPPNFRTDPQWKRIRASMGPHAANVDLDQQADIVMRGLVARRIGNVHSDLDQLARETTWLIEHVETRKTRNQLVRAGEAITEALLALEEIGG